jgi:hypothetical protein
MLNTTREIPPRILAFAQLLLAHEAAAGSLPEQTLAPAFRVMETLRRPLCGLTGVGGCHALIKRALGLSRAQAPYLSAVELKPDGSLIDSPKQAESPKEIPDRDSKAGIELIATLLSLLFTFVGEGLMLRIVLDAWPELTAPAAATFEGSEDDTTK